jgi:hydroxypyruvate reductase
LAVSDVVGDDLSVIGSGPGVGDPSTWREALAHLMRWGGPSAHRPSVVALCDRGAAGELPDTPAPGSADLARADARLIGSARDAIEGSRRAAERLGYQVVVLPEPVVGEARIAAAAWLASARRAIAAVPAPACVLSAGETTVQVVGRGSGGRNQEFALALARAVQSASTSLVAASVGTDGIDGPTDAGGALVDSTTLARAAAAGLGEPEFYLDANDAYAYFAPLGDHIRPGPTGTNVGDLQVLMVGGPAGGRHP